MRRGCLRFVIATAAVVLVLVAWLFGSRPLSMLIDRVYTVQIRSEPIKEFGVQDADTGMFRVNGELIDTTMPDYRRFPMETATDKQGRFTVAINDKSIALGLITQSADATGEAVTPEPADHVTYIVSRSLISWPTPFEFNFMTGHSPSWKRHVYHRLLWQKPDGRKLDMLWRYEQNFYGTDGWDAGGGMREGVCGLLRATIEP